MLSICIQFAAVQVLHRKSSPNDDVQKNRPPPSPTFDRDIPFTHERTTYDSASRSSADGLHFSHINMYPASCLLFVFWSSIEMELFLNNLIQFFLSRLPNWPPRQSTCSGLYLLCCGRTSGDLAPWNRKDRIPSVVSTKELPTRKQRGYYFTPTIPIPRASQPAPLPVRGEPWMKYVFRKLTRHPFHNLPLQVHYHFCATKELYFLHKFCGNWYLIVFSLISQLLSPAFKWSRPQLASIRDDKSFVFLSNYYNFHRNQEMKL